MNHNLGLLSHTNLIIFIDSKYLLGVATGWGATKQQGQTSNKLQEVKVPIMSNIDCRKTAYGSKRITDNMLCAGYPEGQKDSCQVYEKIHCKD